MAYVASGLARWVDAFSVVPTIVASSQHANWQGIEFQEIVPPHTGYFDSSLSRFASDMTVTWLLDSMQQRLNGQRHFSPCVRHPKAYMPYTDVSGEWQGTAPSCSLYVTRAFAEQALGARLRGRFDQDLSRIAPQLEYLLNVLRVDVHARNPVGPAFGEAAALQVLHVIFPDTDRHADLERRSGWSPQIRRVCEIVEANLASPINLVDLSTAAGMSARHLTRAFRAATGQSPHQYIIHRRLERARVLIRRGNLTLGEVAERVGFASHAHMTVTFRKMFGVPPSHFSNTTG